jgi:RNA polymerase sigma-70 factor (sigma-E family)
VSTGPDFEDWVAAHGQRLLRTAWLLTGDRSLAEDLVQSALLRCWPRWTRIRRMDNVDAYVGKVMLSVYLSSQRRRWHAEQPTAQVPEHETSPDPDVDDRHALITALGRLPPGQRAVIVLRFAEDLSEAQTARELGCTIGTVKSQAARGLRALRQDATLLPETDSR